MPTQPDRMTIGLTGEPGRGLVSSTTAQAPAAPTMAAEQAPAPSPMNAAAPAVAEQARTQSASVDPSTMTVQGQLAGLINSGNPLLVQAQTRAAQQANKRGLLNSSIAVGAGESALYDAALPIAQADAGTYRDVALSNADMAQQTELANTGARNQTSQFNVSEQNTTGRFDAQQQQTAALENARLRQQAGTANVENQTRLLLQQMDANTRVEMTNIEANYRTLMQASSSASDLYSQTLRNITDITNNQNLDAAAKNAAIAQQIELMRNGMALLDGVNNLNLSGIVGNLSAPTAAPAPTPPSRAPREPSFGDPDFSGGV